MHVARIGGRYLEGREQRLWIALAGIIGLVMLGLVFVTRSLRPSPMSMLVLVAAGASVALSASRTVSRNLSAVRKGRLGERLVTDLLRQLPDDYCLVNDVMLGRRGNVDHVLIGPCGVVVIETKRLAGHIRCYGDEWCVNGYRRGSISRQVNSGASAVRYFLLDRHPDLAWTALRWVESVVVFTHPLCRLEVDRARTTVVRYSELLQVVRALAEKHRMAPELAVRLAESLVSSQTRVELPR